MPPQPRQQPHVFQSTIDHGNLALNGLYLLVGGHSACLWVFLRKNFGFRAFHVTGIVAIAVMYVYALAAPCREMKLFFPAWLALIVFHRGVSLYRQWRKIDGHSMYDGFPWLAMLLFRPPGEAIAKAVCEPLLAIAVGALLFYTLSEPLGLFIGSASVSLVIKRVIERGIENAEIQSMRDKEFEMRARLARYRSGH
jgi:hypothetical protein